LFLLRESVNERQEWWRRVRGRPATVDQSC
jgi:hypothetical protein